MKSSIVVAFAILVCSWLIILCYGSEQDPNNPDQVETQIPAPPTMAQTEKEDSQFEEHQDANIFNVNGDDTHEKEHIAKHTKMPIDTKKMGQQEFQFHQFRIYDNDHNGWLDGTELIGSLIHWHETNPGIKAGKEEAHHQEFHENVKIFTDEEFMAILDPYLEKHDTNKDGCIDYAEYTIATNANRKNDNRQHRTMS